MTKENLMTSAGLSTDLCNPPPPLGAPRKGGGERAVHLHSRESAATTSRRRFASLGFWLGALALGTAGCVLGVCMPYRHPVAVGLSVLWWGVYLGCLGASVGALVGLVMGRAPVPPVRGPAGAAVRSHADFRENGPVPLRPDELTGSAR